MPDESKKLKTSEFGYPWDYTQWYFDGIQIWCGHKEVIKLTRDDLATMLIEASQVLKEPLRERRNHE